MTGIGVSHLTCKTHCAFYLTQLTNLLVHGFALQTLLIMSEQPIILVYHSSS